MLDVAKKRNRGTVFYRSSFDNFSVSEKFDVIISTFDSINYILNLNQLKNVFKNIVKHLEKKGAFIFDFNTNFKKLKPIIKKRNARLINEIRRGKFWHSYITIKDGKKEFREEHVERLYSLSEIKSALKKSGFSNLKVYSDLNGSRKIVGAARLFIVAKKM